MDKLKIGSVFALALILHASVVAAQCAKDTDCKGNRVCEGGKCVEGSSGPPMRRFRDDAATEEPQAAGVPVSFVGAESDELYFVSVAGKTCPAPCTVRLRPGVQQLVATASGSPSIAAMIAVPETGGTFRLSKGSRPYLASGITLTVVGFIVATSFWSIGLACDDACTVGNLIAWPIIGSGMLFTGIGLLGYGATHATRRGAELIAGGGFMTMTAPRLTSFGLAPSQLGSGATAGASFAF